jgi:hypothetical protein
MQEQGRPDYPTLGRWSGTYVQDMANGYIRDIEVNLGVISL